MHTRVQSQKYEMQEHKIDQLEEEVTKLKKLCQNGERYRGAMLEVVSVIESCEACHAKYYALA